MERIRALNPFARVEVEVGAIAEKDADFFAGFDTVVLVNQPYADELHANQCCRENGARVAQFDDRASSLRGFSLPLCLCRNESGSKLQRHVPRVIGIWHTNGWKLFLSGCLLVRGRTELTPMCDIARVACLCWLAGRSKFVAAHSCGFFATAFVDLLRHECVA